jgi:hypothetical protein
MNIADAAHKTVKEYPGGAEALATRLVTLNDKGEEKPMSGAVLRNKVNPNNSTHHLSLAEASEIMGLTGDDRILHALAAEHGYVLRRADAATGGNVVSALLTVAAKQGELAKAVSDSLDDGQITPNESQEIARICASIQAHAAELAARAETASTGPQ